MAAHNPKYAIGDRVLWTSADPPGAPAVAAYPANAAAVQALADVSFKPTGRGYDHTPTAAYYPAGSIHIGHVAAIGENSVDPKYVVVFGGIAPNNAAAVVAAAAAGDAVISNVTIMGIPESRLKKALHINGDFFESGGSRKKRQSKKKKNQRKHNNNQ
jgi:hypothetical protein